MARNTDDLKMTAHEIESALLKQIDLNDNEVIGEIVGVDGTTITKWKGDGRITKTAKLLVALGFKVVPQDHVFVDMEHLETVFDLAGKGLQAEKERILGK